jgi:hypothetical protein
LEHKLCASTAVAGTAFLILGWGSSVAAAPSPPRPSVSAKYVQSDVPRSLDIELLSAADQRFEDLTAGHAKPTTDDVGRTVGYVETKDPKGRLPRL